MEQTIQNYNNIFWCQIKHYDLCENNILRKVIHSFDVAKNCFELASNKNLNKRERNLSYLIGLFHDIGRFEQWDRFKTYDDIKSVDHGDLSKNILDNMDCEGVFNLNKKEAFIFKEVIRCHTKPYLGANKIVKKFDYILKNCDAMSNVVSTANGMQQMTVKNNGVTKEILNSFYKKEALYRYSPQTKLDRSLKLTACCYYVTDMHFRKNIIESNYIDIIFETFSKYLSKADIKVFKNAIEDLKKDYLK